MRALTQQELDVILSPVAVADISGDDRARAMERKMDQPDG